MIYAANHHIMDFTDIKTVQDLIDRNDKNDPQEDIIKIIVQGIYKQDPAVGLEVVIDILSNLLGFHQEVMEKHMKDGNAEDAVVWSFDVNRIDNAITILKDVKL